MNNIDRIRNILNILFLIGAVASIALYFSSGEDRSLFFYVCGASLFLKMIEFVLRFLLR